MEILVKSFRCLSIILVVLSLVGCNASKETPFIDEELTIPIPEGDLYLRMRGNPEKPLLVNLHGGPGGFSGPDIALMGPHLEEDFLVAYLDQRGCGKSSSCDDPGLLNVDQYVQDLKIVVDSLLQKYNRKKLNLIGHSWGGMYGFLYLLQHQKKINAYASIDGKVNSEYGNNAIIEHELDLTTKLLAQENTPERKAELQEIKEDLLRIREGDFSTFYEDVNRLKHIYPPKLGFNAYFADTTKIVTPSMVLKDTFMLSLMNYTPAAFRQAMQKAEVVNAAFRNNQEYNTLNIELKLSTIKVPTMVVQGEKDYVVGVEQGRIIFDALTALPPEKKELHMLPDVAHNPAVEAPDTLASLIKKFFSQHTHTGAVSK